MKKNSWLFAAVILLVFSLSASCMAEGVVIVAGNSVSELEQSIAVGETLQFVAHKPEIHETYASLPVDDRYQYISFPVTVLNVSTEEIDIAGTVQGKVAYRERFEFEPMLSTLTASDHPLVGEWTIYEVIPGKGESTFKAIIYSVKDDGSADVKWGSWQPQKATYNNATGELALFDGDGAQYFAVNTELGLLGGGGPVDAMRSIGIKGEKSSVLGVLEQETFELVFQVPDAVADAKEDRTFTLTINGEEYRFAF